MQRKISLTYLILVLVLAVDFFTKSLAHQSTQYVKNIGVMMGEFAHLPLMMKSVYLCSVGVCLLTIYVFTVSYLQIKTRRFLIGLSLLFGGILGNVVDRFLYGFIVDFIPFPTLGETSSAYFNLADLFQWLGALLLIWGWKTELDFHFPVGNKRGLQIIQNRLQLRFVVHLFTLFICISAVIFSFSFIFVKSTLIESGIPNPEAALRAYVLMFLAFMGFIAVFILIAAKTISRRIYGPIQAVENYLGDTIAGKSYSFRLREGDYFKPLEAKLTQVNAALTRKGGNHD